jgi:kynurenine formamidase
MRIVDLSHPITEDMPLYPGTPRPRLAPHHRLEADGYRERQITLTTHVGTHVDAPAHLEPDGATLDELPVERFVGRAAVIDAGPLEDGRVPVARFEDARARLAGCDIVLLRTGWSERWGTDAYLRGFPCLAPDAARWLVDQRVKAFGVDAISVDPMGDPELAVHHVLLGAGLVLIENLTGLAALPDDRPFTVCALPLPLTGGDGCPVRAVAILD